MEAHLIRAASTAAILSAALCFSSIAAPILFSDAGANQAAIQGTVDDFRAALGDPNNANDPGPLTEGRREINWDGGGSTATAEVPTPFAAFQNTRGALFTTTGTGFVQATPEGMADVFGNPSYSAFLTFSPFRLFSPIGSNITDATFTIPGSPDTPAFITGFGAVFSDVDDASSTFLEFFDLNGNMIGDAMAVEPFDGGLSFLGVIFDAEERIGRVRLTSGNVAPGPDDSMTSDVVLMDDFLYSEPQIAPQAIPEPAAFSLLGFALTALGALKMRRPKVNQA